MDEMQNFLKEIFEIEKKYHQVEDNESMSVFSVFFNGHEEVTLHSRFISYLLSLKNEKFLELFVREILKIDEDNFNIFQSEVIPNEQNKSEYEEIDILLINEKEGQAIIIENKINANDSIHYDQEIESGYRGQLERYYNTITKGEDKNKKKCKYKCDEDKTIVFYLSLYKKPDNVTIGELRKRGIFDTEKHTLSYYQIQKWLKLCTSNSENLFLNTIIKQYYNLLKKMTTDNERALLLTDLIANDQNNWRSAYILSENLRDIKWHTIHRFFTELAGKLKTQIPDEESITEVAHNSSRKTILKIEFEYFNTRLQIVNDINGFTLGNLETGKWGYFNEKIKDIRFYDFTSESTFHIINNEYRKSVIEEMYSEINKHHSENYVHLTEIF